MTKQQQNKIWDKCWSEHMDFDPHRVLYDRYASEVYPCIKSFFSAEDKIILEAGCGTGRLCCRLAKDFPDSKIIGMDASDNSLKMAGVVKDYIKADNAVFEKGDLFAMKYPDNFFDAVFNEGVIEHFPLNEKPSYVDAVKEMIRVTKPGGKIIVSVPNWYNLVHTFNKWVLKVLNKPYKYGYEKSFKHRELVELFQNLGLEKIELSGFYPAFIFYLASARGGIYMIFNILGWLVDMIAKLDFTKGKKFTKIFGVQIVITGIKPQ